MQTESRTLVQHHIDDIIHIFNTCFKDSYSTILVKGDKEPLYLPSNEICPFNQIIFANGYYSSALHEISHWLVAGKERRKLEDFGYWYCPDGRDLAKQKEFERVEVAPQSYEWMLCVAAGFQFQVSCDNLNGEFEPDHRTFRKRVRAKVLERLSRPFSPRFQTLLKALHEFYQTPSLKSSDFSD